MRFDQRFTMKAIILASRKATRLLPLTKDTPQCLLKVGSKTILEHQVEFLRAAGIKEIVVITGYLADKVQTQCNILKIKGVFNPFYAVSNMSMALWIAKEELREGFIFLYSDILFDSKIVDNLLKQEGDICLAIKKDGFREEAEKVVETEGVIVEISKEHMFGENGEFIGIAKLSDRGAKKLIAALENMSKQTINSTLIESLSRLIKRGEVVSAYDIGKNVLFVDIDFPEDLKKAEELSDY